MTRHFLSDFNVDNLFLPDSNIISAWPPYTWITCAAIPIHILAVKRNDHGILAYVFDSGRTPNSFFIDCFSFEGNCFWERHSVFS